MTFRSMDASGVRTSVDLLMSTPVRRGTVLCMIIVALPAENCLGKYDDTVLLLNGDRLSGDVKEMRRDMLRFKTDSMGTVYIRWEDVRSLETSKNLRIELKSGRRVVGSINQADAPNQLLIATHEHDEQHDFDEIVAFVPLMLRSNWLERLEGSIKFGLNSTKGSNTTQWSVGGFVQYRGESWELSSQINSIVTDKSDNTSSERIKFTNTYRHLLRNRWFWSALAGYDRNDELGIDGRYSGGGGIGRYFIRSNGIEFLLQSGLVASREVSTDTSSSQLEAYLGGSLAWFKYRFPKTDIHTDVTVLPSLTESGRIRTNWDISIAREIVEDLSLELSIYYSTDNQPPDEASRDDWGVVTSIGYTF